MSSESGSLLRLSFSESDESDNAIWCLCAVVSAETRLQILRRSIALSLGDARGGFDSH